MSDWMAFLADRLEEDDSFAIDVQQPQVGLPRWIGQRWERETEAKRALIGEQTSDHAPIESAYGLTCRTCVAWQDDEGAHEFGIAIPEVWPCGVARAFGAIYRDHPDHPLRPQPPRPGDEQGVGQEREKQAREHEGNPS